MKVASQKKSIFSSLFFLIAIDISYLFDKTRISTNIVFGKLSQFRPAQHKGDVMDHHFVLCFNNGVREAHQGASIGEVIKKAKEPPSKLKSFFQDGKFTLVASVAYCRCPHTPQSEAACEHDLGLVGIQTLDNKHPRGCCCEMCGGAG